MYKLITPYASDFGPRRGGASRPNVVIKHFPDTESYVFIPKVASLKNKKVTIYHRLFPEPDKRLFELVLILSRVVKETKQVELLVPYLPYARQDKEHEPGDVVSADVLCGLLKTYGVKKLITYDCHFLPKPGNFVRGGLKIENRSAGKQLLAYAKKYFAKGKIREKFIVISPDQGSSYFVQNAEGYAMHKKRKRTNKNDIKTEVHMENKLNELMDVKGKNICILDDIIATGGTIRRAAEHLKARGAKKIIVGAVHGVFCGDNIAEKILKSSCDEIFTTNAVINNSNQNVKILKLKLV
ncbi:ribose-phosphate diphosphokinase [Candidatus Nomurabacteria bacterium]|nr:ribose-phosphate diphosphokinase [Candidatus Nomurabacteria bacterium]